MRAHEHRDGLVGVVKCPDFSEAVSLVKAHRPWIGRLKADLGGDRERMSLCMLKYRFVEGRTDTLVAITS